MIDQPFICVTGGARCGTTLLSAILDASDDIQISPENSLLTNLFVNFLPDDVLDERLKKSLIKEVRNDNKLLGNDGRLKNRFLEYIDSKACVKARDVLEFYFALLNGDSVATKFFGQKKNFLEISGRLDLWFSQIIFICIFRDPRNSCISAFRALSGWSSYLAVAVSWDRRVLQALGLKDSRKCAVVLRHEDFVENPVQALERVGQSIGIQITPEMLDFHFESKTLKNLPDSERHKHLGISQPVGKVDLEKWKGTRTVLSDFLISSIARRSMIALQYPISSNCVFIYSIIGLFLRYGLKLREKYF